MVCIEKAGLDDKNYDKLKALAACRNETHFARLKFGNDN
jgi:hypothetical protein